PGGRPGLPGQGADRLVPRTLGAGAGPRRGQDAPAGAAGAAQPDAGGGGAGGGGFAGGPPRSPARDGRGGPAGGPAAAAAAVRGGLGRDPVPAAHDEHGQASAGASAALV